MSRHAVVFAAATILSVAGVAGAGIIQVDSTAGDRVDQPGVNGAGNCSLREAMQNVANSAQTWDDCEAADAGPDIINIVVGGDIVLDSSGSLPTPDGMLTVNGPATIDMNNDASFIFALTVSGIDLTLNEITLQNAGTSAISLQGDSNLTANASVFANNNANTGGAITSGGSGTIRLNACQFTSNDATGNGGAINKGTAASLFVTATSFTDNSADRGGAIYLAGQSALSATVIDLSTFQGNNSDGTDAADGGGAIYFVSGNAGSVVSISGTVFGGPGPLGNTADQRGGAIYNQSNDGLFNSDLTDFLSGGIVGCLFENNSATNGDGGAIYNQGTIHVLNSSFDGNAATNGNGGAIGDNQMVSGRLIVAANSTFNGNSAGGNGGAISMSNNNGNIDLYNSTLSGNTAAGSGREIFANTSSDVVLANTIIANTSAGPNCSATGIFTDSGGNLVYDPGNNGCGGLAAGGDPQLAGLTFNGGPLFLVQTMEPAGAPALGIGVPATCGAWPVLSLDGRGLIRPSACDAGAHEAGTAGRVVINEFDHDQGATDDHEFIELYNGGSDSVDLDNYTLELVDGDAGGAAVYRTIDLPSSSLPAGEFFVICGQTNADLPAINCDLDATPDTDLIEDGDPDAIGLRVAGILVDAVSYEGDSGAPYVETAGTGADTPAEDFFGFSRITDGIDTDDNSADFGGRCATPKLPNSTATSGCMVVPVALKAFSIE
jgi:predicted outer membrane repeat protein